MLSLLRRDRLWPGGPSHMKSHIFCNYIFLLKSLLEELAFPNQVRDRLCYSKIQEALSRRLAVFQIENVFD
jgi:hypothetical protein